MAYTDEAYSYSDVVFTGLPILSLHTAEEITTEDTPAALNLAFGNGERLEANARAHLRGNASLVRLDKHSYKVEFTRTEDGKKKIPQNVPGLGQTDEIILLAMGFDRANLAEGRGVRARRQGIRRGLRQRCVSGRIPDDGSV